MHDPKERILIDLSYEDFSNGILSALEKDTGAIPIIPEIIRILKIKMRKEAIRNQRCKNLKQNKQGTKNGKI